MKPEPLMSNSADENTETTSKRRIEANRQNAQLSTGPKSAEGKKNSSQNAVKHGLLIENVVITTRGCKEDPDEFEALLSELRECYEPRDIAEDLLVRELVVSYWRSARALRCERSDVTCAGAERKEPEEFNQLEILSLECRPAAEAYRVQLRSSRGIKFLLDKLEQARTEVGASGSLPDELLRWIAPDKDWSNIACAGSEALLGALEKEIAELTAEKGRLEHEEFQWRNDQRDRSAIPSKETLDRIHRYETSNVRHRYKVEARLQQLQQRPKQNAMATSGDKCLENAQFCETKPTDRDDERFRKGPVGTGEQRSDDIAMPIETALTGD
jgi:hypothetical protein